MKLTWIVLLGFGILTTQAYADDASSLTTHKDKLNYSLGVQIARNYKKQGFDIDLDTLIKGIKDELSGGKLLISENELRKIFQEIQATSRRQQRADKAKISPPTE